MRNFGPNIFINGEELNNPLQVQNYEALVYHQLLTIVDVGGGGESYKTGLWVLKELTHTLTIRPSIAQKFDADGKPMTDVLAHPVMITDLQNSSAGDNPEDEFRVNFDVPGRGTNVTIRYSPDPWWYLDTQRVGFDAQKHQYVQLNNDKTPIGSEATAIGPDDILLHEMVHAARQMKGLWLNPAMNNMGDSDYGSYEEFFAVVVANIYVSERSTSYHPRLLRGKYTIKTDGTDSLFHELDKSLQTSGAFVDRYSDALGKLCNDMPLFTDRLSIVKAKFNPIKVWKDRDYLRRNPPVKGEGVPMENPFGGWTPKL